MPGLKKLAWAGLAAGLVALSVWLASRPVSILLLGTDFTDFSQHTDTIILAKFYPLSKRLDILSIPRDTLVTIPGVGPAKANFAYSYGYGLGKSRKGAEMASRTVSSLLNERIPFYLHLRYEGFIKIIDDLGGIDVDVEEDMNYEDHANKLFIHIKKGKQTLFGTEALKYVRFRADGRGDLGRMKRQQKFLRRCWERLSSPFGLTRVPMLLKDFSGYVDTDLSLFDLLWLAKKLAMVSLNNIKTATLPGEPLRVHGVDYWNPDVAKLKAEELKVTAEAPVSTIVQKEETPEEPPKVAVKAAKPGNPKQEAVRLEILNGSGIPKVTYWAEKKLAGLPVEVVHKGNARSFKNYSTQIKTTLKDKKLLLKIAKALGCKAKNIKHVKALDRHAEVSIVLGKDFKPR